MGETASEATIFDLSSEHLSLDFANTVSWRRGDRPEERLKRYSDLVAWGQQAGALTDVEAQRLLHSAGRHPAVAASVLARAIALREAIYSLFSAVARGGVPPAADLATLNTALSDALRHARVLPTTSGFGWGWADGEALDRVLWPVARSAAELLTSDELIRVRQCAGAGCGWLFMDRSRAGRRQWCDMKVCGNRAKARRHYERTRRASDDRRGGGVRSGGARSRGGRPAP